MALEHARHLLGAHFRLVQFCERNLRRALGLRLTKLAALGIASSVALLLFVVARRSPDSVDGALVRGVTLLSWVVGIGVCWGAAGRFTGFYEASGLATLAALRGFSRSELRRAHALAAAARVFRLAALPAVVLVLLSMALATNTTELGRRALLLGPILVHGVFLSALTHALLRLISSAADTQQRLLLLFVWIGPELARAIWPAAPSVSGALQWMSDGLYAAVGP